MGFLEKILSTNLVGLDIGTTTIKFVQLKSNAKTYEWVKGGVVEIPGVSSQEEVDAELTEALLVETIKKLFKENKINSKNVVTAVSGDAVIVRHVKLPAMSPDELKGVIQYEAEQYIPNVDQFDLDFQILGEITEDNQKKMEVLLVGAKHELLERHLKVLSDAGLKPIIIDADSLSLANAYEVNYTEAQEEGGVALLNIGSKLTTICIMEGTKLRSTRDVFIGGKNFTLDIQREFNLDYSQSEELKKLQASIVIESEDISLLRMPNKDDRSIQIFEAISGNLNKLVTEIRRFFDYYENLSKKVKIGKVILGGGSSRIKNMDKFLQDKLDLPVEWNDPFKSVILPKDKEETLNQQASFFAVAVGLAARRV